MNKLYVSFNDYQKSTAATESSHARESKQTTIYKGPKTLKHNIGYKEEDKEESVQKKNKAIPMDIIN
jgi:hypothetical protein